MARRVSQGRSGIARPGTIVLRQFVDTCVSTIFAIFADQSLAIFADHLLAIFADFCSHSSHPASGKYLVGKYSTDSVSVMVPGGGWRSQGCHGYHPTMHPLPTGTSSQAHHFDEFNTD